MTKYENIKSMDDAHGKLEVAKLMVIAYVNGMIIGQIMNENPDYSEVEVKAEYESFKEGGFYKELLKDPSTKELLREFYEDLSKEVESNAEA